MKDLNLMFNSAKPEIHFLVSAGQSVNISTPGVYHIVPINLDTIAAGISTEERNEKETDDTFTPSTLELNQPAEKAEINKPLHLTSGRPVEQLFTQTLSNLLANSRQK